jgi:hypothetical protein
MKLRRSTYQCQGFVDGKIVWAGKIAGLLGPAMPEIFRDGI